MRFSVSVPVLSVQITSVEPSVSTALSRLTSAPRRASDPDRDREREGDDRQQPLRDVAGEQPDREDDAVLQRQPGAEDRDRDERDRDRRPRSPRSARRRGGPASRAGSAPSLTRSDSAAMRPSSVRIPVAKTTPRGLARRCALVPLNTRSRASSRGTPGSIRSAERNTGADSPVSVDRSTSTAPAIRRMSAATRSPSSTSDDIARDELGAGIRCGARRRAAPDLLGRNCGEGLDGSLRLHLLDQRERGVQRDHEQHRDRHRLAADRERQCGGEPQQQRERVGQLARDLGGPCGPAAALELVRAVLEQAPPGLLAAQPVAVAAEIAQQEPYRLLDIRLMETHMDGKDRTARAAGHPGFARRTPPERRLDPLPVAAFSSSPRPCEAFC